MDLISSGKATAPSSWPLSWMLQFNVGSLGVVHNKPHFACFQETDEVSYSMPQLCHTVSAQNGTILDPWSGIEFSHNKVGVDFFFRFNFTKTPKNSPEPSWSLFFLFPFPQVFGFMQILLSKWTAWTIRAKVLNWDLRSKCILRKFLLLSQGLLADHLPKWPQQISTRHFRLVI